MKISEKLILGFTGVILLTIIIGLMGIKGMDNLREANKSLYEKQVIGLEYVGKATTAFKQTRIECRQVVITSLYDDLKGATDAKERFYKTANDFRFWLKECIYVADDEELLRFYEKIEQLFNESYMPAAENLVEEAIKDVPEHADKLYVRVLLAATVGQGERIENIIIGTMNLNAMLAQHTNENNERFTDFFVGVQSLLLICAVITAMSVALFITQSISTPINEATEVLSRIAGGDFDARVKGDYKGDLEVIKDSINETAKQLSIYLAEKLQEDKIRELAAIVAIADAGIIIKDKEGIVTEWNIGAKHILGYEPEEMLGRTTHHYSPVESHASIDEVELLLQQGKSTGRADVVRKHKDGRLIDCSASYTPIFGKNNDFEGSVAIFHDISDKKKMEMALKEAVATAEEKHATIMESLDYARKIQQSLISNESVFQNAFSDYSIVWRPRDTVGGDIYWIKSFDEGTVLCVCDCTGHGTPGALLTMLVVSAFESDVNESNYKNPAQIIWNLDRSLANVCNFEEEVQGASCNISNVKDGCDLAVLYISNNGNVDISSGNTQVFVCDGKDVKRIKGQRLYVGEGKIKSADEIKIINIPANSDNKYYIASDGLYDQIGGSKNLPFGYKTFERLILEHHNEKQPVIIEKVWEAFEAHKGINMRRDDIEIIAFKPKEL